MIADENAAILYIFINLEEGNFMIEFEGFVSHDFDFFKKKDKLAKEEYNNLRNNLKQNFRSMCYEIQKMYHSNTNGFYEIDKEFQNFGKKSTEIEARHVLEESRYSIVYELNSNNISISLSMPNLAENIENTLDVIKSKKDKLMDVIMQSKNVEMYASIGRGSKENNIIKLHGFEASSKNCEAFLNSIESAVKEGKNILNISIKYIYNKNECIKLGKDFISTAYDCTMKLYDIYNFMK